MLEESPLESQPTESREMDKWYYSWNGEKIGPVSIAELERLVEDGTLEPTDLVWTKGMPDWQPASRVPALPFPDEPPPLPNSQAIRKVIDGRWDEAIPAAARWLWDHKPAFFLVGAIVSGATATILASERAPDEYIFAAVIPTVLFVLGLIIVGLVSAFEWGYKSQRKGWLQQKWESTHRDGSWIQFSQDGGFVRSDGFGAKYMFDIPNDRIELRPVDDSPPVLLKVVLLSEKELALTWDGQTQHYQRPSWWKRTFG
jgi:hypothetical protein